MNAHSVSSHVFAVAVSVTVLVLAVSSAEGSIITDADIVPVPSHMVHSGNGQLDLILFTSANGLGVNNNEIRERGAVIFNGDDANTDMPVGAGKAHRRHHRKGRNKRASESYITSIGDLRNFYRTIFSDGQGGSTVDEIVLFVDLNETGRCRGKKTSDYIMLKTLDIVVGYDAFGGADIRNDPWNNDIGSGAQNGTGAGFSGGTTVANLDSAPKRLQVIANGSGWADYMIYTGVNPFGSAFADETPILFFWESAMHKGGGADVFITGAGAAVPEPGTMALLTFGACLRLLRKRR